MIEPNINGPVAEIQKMFLLIRRVFAVDSATLFSLAAEDIIEFGSSGEEQFSSKEGTPGGEFFRKYYWKYQELLVGRFGSKESCRQLEIGKEQPLDKPHSKLACRNRILQCM